MKLPQWNKRFLATTRGRIIALLRPAGCTVSELAAALDLTDNAVRAHLTTLERDGLVRQSGLRPGPRKPHYAYELTPEAEQLFPKAYGAILNQILDVLDDQLPEETRQAILQEVGRRMAATHVAAVEGESLEKRLQLVIDIFRELGGLARVEKEGEHVQIRTNTCPLAAVSSQHPQICRFAETLVSEILGRPAREHCTHGESPQCCFQIDAV